MKKRQIDKNKKKKKKMRNNAPEFQYSWPVDDNTRDWTIYSVL